MIKKYYRVEIDSMGEIEVPKKKLWGAQTQRSLEYFCISNEKMPIEVIKSLVLIKKAVAKTNYDLGLLGYNKYKAIIQSVDKILSGNYWDEFPLFVWQTGSGTQTNMNVNEVIANLSSEILGGERGINRIVHPNDDVNKSQSSNDVFPTAMNISAVMSLKNNLLPNIEKLKNTFIKKSNKFKKIIKIGRTHLQDATPISLGDSISAWVYMLDKSIKHIKKGIFHLYELALGGTTVGNGLNTYPKYSSKAIKIIAEITKQPFINSPNKFESISTCDSLVQSHGSLKGLSVSLMKIANDIRWLSSGPRCGIGELYIPENEPGSSMMPGKVNPTQCESMTMICCQVIGNDTSINIGGASGNFELNVYRPMIIYNYLQSVRILSDGINSFNKYCAIGIKPNIERISYFLNSSLMLVTALNKHIGYDKSAKIANIALKKGLTLKKAALESGYLTEENFDEWVKPEEMAKIIK